MKIEELQNQVLDWENKYNQLEASSTGKDATIKNLEAQIAKLNDDYTALQGDYNESLRINTRLFAQRYETAVHVEPEVETKPEVDEGPNLEDLF